MLKANEFVKIWFSKSDAHPLGGQLNEYRLWSHRIRFPNDKITLISNFNSFSVENQNYLKDFCQQWNIKLISLQAVEQELVDMQQTNHQKLSELKNDLATEIKKHRKLNIQESLNLCQLKSKDIETQLALLNIAKTEIAECFGCLAAASDIVRILSPIAKHGIYTDFDVVKLNDTQKNLRPELGLLLDGLFEILPSGQVNFSLLCNNNFYCDETQSGFLRIYRERMLTMYTVNKEVNTLLKSISSKKIFVAKEYNAACTYMKAEKEALKHYPYALKIRAALKMFVNENCYERFLKDFVLDISGPGCMHDAFETYYGKEFIPYCEARKIYSNSMARLFGAFRLDYPCINEDDVSWLKSESQTEQRYDKIQSATRTLQSFFRMSIAQKKYQQEKNADQPKSPRK